MQAAEAYEDRFPMTLTQLEAVPLVADGPGISAFPYPRLRPTESSSPLEMPSVVLENQYLKATFLPELGGRLISLFDKRTQTEILPPASLARGGPRGVTLPWGAEVWLEGESRRNALGPVDFDLLEPDDTGSATLVLGELPAGSPLSWHLLVTLPPDRAEILMEFRVQNRSWHPAPYQAQIAWATGDAARAGVACHGEPGDFEAPFVRAGQTLGPLETDTYGFRVGVYSGIGAPTATQPFGALAMDAGKLKFQAAATALGAKLVLQTADGRALEASADLYPERIFEADIEGLAVDGVAILGADREPLFRWVRHEAAPSGFTGDAEQARHVAVDALRAGSSAPAALRRMREDGGLRGLAEMLSALAAMRDGDLPSAERFLQDFLGRNAESPLGWWYLAVVRRMQGQEGDRPELLNAHFLAPLEPLLRAESYLANPSSEKEPSALLKSLAAQPDAMVEVAVRLHDAGLFEELMRWVDECLRHREIPMLRYLLADALYAASRMQAEAAQHVQTAFKTPVNPPYPWRETETLVLARLQARFPENARIRDLLSLCLRARTHSPIHLGSKAE